MSKLTNDKELLIKINDIVAGAVFDLLGWLTTRDERLTLSSTDLAGPAADAVSTFLKMRGIQSITPNINTWSEDIRIDPPSSLLEDLPEGFYLLSSNKTLETSLVKVYTCDDFNGIKHIAFGPWDGGGIMPLSHLSENSKLTPITMMTCDKPINELATLIK